MFPLLDLDDDAIIAALGFDDPRSLACTESTCRRLRRLVDAAWSVLDKNIESNKREGGETPRERMLSSYVVHRRKGWLKEMTKKVVSDPNNAGLQSTTSEELQVHNHLFYLRIGFVAGRELVSSCVSVTVEQSRSLADHDSIVDLPIPEEKLMGHYKEFIDKYYSGTENLGRFVGSDGLLPLSVKKDIYHVFDYVTIAMVVVNRKTLKPSILFRDTSKYRSPDLWIRCVRLRDGSYRVVVNGDWAMKSEDPKSIKTRKVGFYFEDDSFGLTIDTN